MIISRFIRAARVRNKSKFKIKENTQPCCFRYKLAISLDHLTQWPQKGSGSKQEVWAQGILKAPEGNFYFLIYPVPISFLIRAEPPVWRAAPLSRLSIWFLQGLFVLNLSSSHVHPGVDTPSKAKQIQILPWDVLQSLTEGRTSFFALPHATRNQNFWNT